MGAYKTVFPGTVSGRVTIPASKSLSHRAMICAALANGDSTLRHVSWSKDLEATAFAMERMGAIFWRDGDTLTIRGIGGTLLRGKVERLFCGESASTVRFLIPIAGVLGLRTIFTGMGQLPKRPLDPYCRLMEEHGFGYEQEGRDQLPLLVKGGWKSGHFTLPGDISSQFITGLLMAMPLAEGDSVIELTSPLESAPYVGMTIQVLKQFGIHIVSEDNKVFRIPGGQRYQAGRFNLEGDYTQASVFLAAGAVAGEEEGLILDGLLPDSIQGDKEILPLLQQMNVETRWLEDGGLQVFPADEIHNFTWNASQNPDLVPALTVLSAFGEGIMRVTGAARLRLKECDRLKALCTELKKMGVWIDESEDGLVIRGEPDGLYEGGEADSWNDHRVAMSLAVVALRTFRGIGIKDADCTSKSWPSFWQDFEQIGGGIED